MGRSGWFDPKRQGISLLAQFTALLTLRPNEYAYQGGKGGKARCYSRDGFIVGHEANASQKSSHPDRKCEYLALQG